MGYVSCEITNNTAIVTIMNPPLNVLNRAVVSELSQLADELNANNEVKAVIITGDGQKAFMAGADINEFPELIKKGEGLAEQKSLDLQEAFQKIYHLSKPTIAAINGLALGGGCELALACDLRIMEAHSVIGLPEIKLGLFPGAGGTQRLPRLIGEAKAKELMFSGEPISAERAKEIGLINEIVESGKSLEHAIKLTGSFSNYSLPALKYMKNAINEGIHSNLNNGLAIEAAYFGKVFQTEEISEGIRAFLEKRKAVY